MSNYMVMLIKVRVTRPYIYIYIGAILCGFVLQSYREATKVGRRTKASAVSKRDPNQSNNSYNKMEMDLGEKKTTRKKERKNERKKGCRMKEEGGLFLRQDL